MTIDEIIQDIKIDDSQKSRNCEYFSGKERYCKATNNKSCRRCNFFSPNHQLKVQMLMDKYENLAKENDKNIHTMAKLGSQIDSLRRRNEELEHLVLTMQEFTCTDRQRCKPYFDREVTCKLASKTEAMLLKRAERKRKGKMIFG